MAAAAPQLNLAKNARAQKVLAGMLLAIVFICYYVFVHTDVASKIDGEKRRSATLDQDLATQRQSQATYFADRDELVMRQQRQRELNKILPADTEAAAFLSAIQSVSNVSGIDLKAWQPQDERAETFFARVPMRLEISGRFHQIAKFVYEVGKLDRIINMENIELTNPQVVGTDVILQAHCLATTFHALKKAGAK